MLELDKAVRFREQAKRLRALIAPEELVKERVYNPLVEVLETLADMLEMQTITEVLNEEPAEIPQRRGPGRPRKVQ